MSFQDYTESTSSGFRLGTVNPRLLVGVVVLALSVFLCVALALGACRGDDAGFSVQSASAASSQALAAASEAPPEPDEPAEICVHVGGCVQAPGVFYLNEGDRVADAVERAGGMTPEAAADGVNLARMLVDGEQIIVASVEEATAMPAVSATGTAPTTAGGAAGAASGKVNINTASSQELQTISGIGEAKAKRIIDYREKNGPFKTVDDLTAVSGIGEKTLENLRDQICV